MPEDRRVNKTKKRIRNALLKCLEEKKLEKITVKEICELADINRSTFYVHYSNPLMLYNDIQRDFLNGLDYYFEKFENGEVNYNGFLRNMFQYFSEKRDIYLSLFKADDIKFRAAYMEKSTSYQLASSDINSGMERYVREFYVSGTVRIITLWLESGQKESIEDMAALVCGMSAAMKTVS